MELQIKIAISKVDIALQYCNQETINECIDRGFRPKEKQFVTLLLRQLPMELIDNLLRYSELSKNQARTLTKFLQYKSGDTNNIEDITNCKTLFYILESMGNTSDTPNCLVEYSKRTFAMRINCEYNNYNYSNQQKTLTLSVMADICNNIITITELSITDDFFTDSFGSSISYTLKEIFERCGLKLIPDDFENCNSTQLIKTQQMQRHHKGKMFQIKSGSTVLEKWEFAFYKGIQEKNLDTDEKVILENHIELSDDTRYSHRTFTKLPYVRGFLLNQKKYCFVHVDDIVNYKYDTDSIKKLALPTELKTTLTRLFKSQKKFDDIVKDKSQGMILLAYGSSGTGKTLTAEVFSEYMQRPLYHLEISELGANLQLIEENLQRIFLRVTRWNCILLFDECDIFLASRGNDLQRSALVGIFLRLLDYYSGFLFLTTNRPDVIDPAFKSRITLSLKYPELTNAIRKKIYQTLLQSNGMTLNEISKIDLNGRQIRNVCKLANTFDSVNESDLIQLAKYQL
jgi:hypothetical protein